jgi:alpha-galactosidase
MIKVAIIGAGSVVFCKTLMLDIMAIPDIGDIEFALMAPSTKRTAYVSEFANRVIKQNDIRASVYITTDRRDALKNANYVIATLQIGGISAYEHDYKIPYKYGVDQCIGDTLGPGGVFRALRSIPIMLDIAKDMEEICPNALLLNYVNPMAMICWALGETKIKSIGLCHGVQTTIDLISGYTNVDKQELDYICAGINHMGWFLKIEHNGKDLYPTLRENFEKPEYYANEKVRGEVFRNFGYFMTESTGHLSEYLPYFRKNDLGLGLYCDEPAFGGETGAYYTWCKFVSERYSKINSLANESTILPKRSLEYGSHIIEAIELDRPFRLNGNIRNNGLISNLPLDCCTEVPIFVDGSGLHPTYIGALPSQLAALNLTNINVQRLTVEAAKSGDPEAVVYACALDPLTSAKLTLKEIREMVTEMLEAEAEWLPQFGGRKPKSTPTIIIPQDVKRAAVPVDPALAINARFGELLK